MIITSKLNELAIHSQVIGGGIQVWRDVHLEAELPYFMVIYSVRETNSRVRQTCLIWQQQDLISLCDQIELNLDMDLIRVCLLSPPWMNGSKIWKIDPVQEIWSATHCDDGIATCYVLEDSNRYVDSRIFPDPSNWTFTDSVFVSNKYTRILDFDSEHCVEICTNSATRLSLEKKTPRKSGRMKGKIKISDDFDAPMKTDIDLEFNGDT